MSRFEGKVAVITGASGGIGLAASKLFAKEGAKVLLVDIEEADLDNAVTEIGSDSSYFVADVTQPERVQAYVAAAVQRYGGIDIFINNAGIEGDLDTIVDCDIDNFDRVIAVNVRGVWLGLKYVIPQIEKRGGGSIVITSSIGGVSGGSGMSPYIASKHAVIGLMRTASDECAPKGIRVNTVNPGPTDTRMMRSIEEQNAPGNAELAKQGYISRVPLNRYATAEDIANMMLFLSSDEGSYCSGGIYVVDGGMTKY